MDSMFHLYVSLYSSLFLQPLPIRGKIIPEVIGTVWRNRLVGGDKEVKATCFFSRAAHVEKEGGIYLPLVLFHSGTPNPHGCLATGVLQFFSAIIKHDKRWEPWQQQSHRRAAVSPLASFVASAVVQSCSDQDPL